MIFLEIFNGDYDALTKTLLLVVLPVVILMSLSIHEYAHALVSYSLGDQTAKKSGRLTVNPLKHLHPIGTLCMFLFQFGWARPVPVEPRYYKNPKKGMALCGLAGPAVNLMMGIHSYSVYCLFVWFASHNEVFVLIPLIGSMPDQMFIFVAQTMGLIGYYNILLAIFNLLPIPPFDGSRLMYAFLPDRYYFGVMKHERTIMFVVLALLWIGVLDILFDAVFTAVSFVVESAVIGGLDVILSLLSGV